MWEIIFRNRKIGSLVTRSSEIGQIHLSDDKIKRKPYLATEFSLFSIPKKDNSIWKSKLQIEIILSHCDVIFPLQNQQNSNAYNQITDLKWFPKIVCISLRNIS